MAGNQTRIDHFSIFEVTQNEHNRLLRNQKEGQVGLRTYWSKERGGLDSMEEPYDARVYTLELKERDPKQSLCTISSPLVIIEYFICINFS